jgi:hypothetical protein
LKQDSTRGLQLGGEPFERRQRGGPVDGHRLLHDLPDRVRLTIPHVMEKVRHIALLVQERLWPRQRMELPDRGMERRWTIER